jgi:hypothetical protein
MSIEDDSATEVRADQERQDEFDRRRGERRQAEDPIEHPDRRAKPTRRRTPGLGALIGALFGRPL